MAQAAVRILYLALADARGHLMRAHLLRALLAERGIAVDVVTTSTAGQRFLEALGTPSRVLSEHFCVSFEGCHDMSRSKTDACVLRYYLDPSRGLRDLARIRRWAKGAAFVVCDSLHPALLVAPWLTRLRVVHVFGENIWSTALENFTERGPRWLDRLYRFVLPAMREAAFASVVHTLDDRLSLGPRTIALPPILPVPKRSPAKVRSSLGLAPNDRLAAVYLNPHFADPSVACAVEQTLAKRGYRVHGVGEGYANRRGWVARDADLASVIRAADLFVSGAGMGAMAQCRVFGTPLIALLGNQPEQLKNAAQMRHARFDSVRLNEPSLERALENALDRLEPTRFRVLTDSALDVQRAWAETFVDLVQRATKENKENDLEQPNHLARPRNQQPGRRRERVPNGKPRAPTRTFAKPNSAARFTRRAGGHA